VVIQIFLAARLPAVRCALANMLRRNEASAIANQPRFNPLAGGGQPFRRIMAEAQRVPREAMQLRDLTSNPVLCAPVSRPPIPSPAL